MTKWMALFGLIWLLRVRGSLCGCSACKRAKRINYRNQDDDDDEMPIERVQAQEISTFDVVSLGQFTRDVTVQTDFDDDEDLEKIEMDNIRDANVPSYEYGRDAAGCPGSGRRLSGSNQFGQNIDNESLWETIEVNLERCTSGLGLSIASGEDNGDITITRIADGGAAKIDGRLQLGDIVLQVNDISIEGAKHSIAVEALQKAGNVVRLRVKRARHPRVVTLWRGARGLGLGIAGGSDNVDGSQGIFVSHVATGGAAYHDGRLRLGDKILAVRDQDGIETSLLGATHAEAVAAMRDTGDRITMVVFPAGSLPSVTRTATLYNTRTQATSCSTLHELLDEDQSSIPRCVRMIRLVRSGSRLGMDIVGGLGGETDANGSEEEACGVFVSGVALDGAANGMLYRGDRILSVDGKDLSQATHEQAAAALKYSGGTVMIAAQYQPEHYERLRARIRAINAAAATSQSRQVTQIPVYPELHSTYPR